MGQFLVKCPVTWQWKHLGLPGPRGVSLLDRVHFSYEDVVNCFLASCPVCAGLSRSLGFVVLLEEAQRVKHRKQVCHTEGKGQVIKP